MMFILHFVISCIVWWRLSASTPPHIIMIVMDDLGWGDVSFHGSDQIPTPHIDTLASAGIILNNYYVSPICTPSRGALMSGKHPIHTGLQHDVIYAGEPWGLPLNITTLPQHLKRLGYTTHGIGKWHLGFFKTDYTPIERGFDSHFGYYTGHEDYYDHTALSSVGWGTDFNDNLVVVRDAVGQYATELFTERAVRIINKHNSSSEPLFLYLAHLAVHVANNYKLFQAPEKYIDKFAYITDQRRQIFAGMISALDDSVGKIVEALDKASMLDNTIIVLTTDNGGAAGGIDEGVGCNWPLRGSKYTLWEGGVRGTAVLWTSMMPKKKGRISDQMMHITDWLPTLYSAAGGNVRDLEPIYGLDLWESLLNDLPSPRREILHNIDPIWKTSALRWYDYKIVYGSVFGGEFDDWYPCIGENKTKIKKYSSTERILKSRGWNARSIAKYQVQCGPRPENFTTNCKPLEKPCLFNIRTDPCEFYNIAEEKPQILNLLMERLDGWASTAVPPAKLPEDPKANPRYHDYAWVPWLDED